MHKVIIRGEGIVKYMKTQRIIWWGYLNRMEGTDFWLVHDKIKN